MASGGEGGRTMRVWARSTLLRLQHKPHSVTFFNHATFGLQWKQLLFLSLVSPFLSWCNSGERVNLASWLSVQKQTDCKQYQWTCRKGCCCGRLLTNLYDKTAFDSLWSLGTVILWEKVSGWGKTAVRKWMQKFEFSAFWRPFVRVQFE